MTIIIVFLYNFFLYIIDKKSIASLFTILIKDKFYYNHIFTENNEKLLICIYINGTTKITYKFYYCVVV